eukprot:1242459-Rhodomonas_salina.4
MVLFIGTTAPQKEATLLFMEAVLTPGAVVGAASLARGRSAAAPRPGTATPLPPYAHPRY